MCCTYVQYFTNSFFMSMDYSVFVPSIFASSLLTNSALTLTFSTWLFGCYRDLMKLASVNKTTVCCKKTTYVKSQAKSGLHINIVSLSFWCSLTTNTESSAKIGKTFPKKHAYYTNIAFALFSYWFLYYSTQYIKVKIPVHMLTV